MALWGTGNQANASVKTASAGLPNGGSGNADHVIKNTALFGNTTPGAYILNTTVSQILVSVFDITSGTIKVDNGPGWYLKRVGTGGRSGRVTYESLVAARFGGAATAPQKLLLNARWVAEGDSITAGSNGPPYLLAAMIKSEGRYFNPYLYNQATGGQTAAGMATQIASITALSPKVVTLLAGTNDLGGTSDTPATIYANLKTCWKGYIDGGASNLVIMTVMPRNDTTFTNLGAGRETDRQTLNTLIRGFAADATLSAYKSKITLIDLEAFNPTTMASDGLHPNWLGAFFVGNLVGDALTTLIDTASKLTDLYSDASNLIAVAGKNPLLTGTTGTFSGTPTPSGQVATGWSVAQNDAVTAVCSKTTLNGAPAQNIVVSGNCAVANRVVNFSATIAYSGVAGDQMEMAIDFSLAAGHTGLRSISVACDTALSPGASQTVLMDGVGAITGTLRTPITTPLAGTDVSSSVQGILTMAVGAVSANITWGRPYFRKVPNGQ